MNVRGSYNSNNKVEHAQSHNTIINNSVIENTRTGDHSGNDSGIIIQHGLHSSNANANAPHLNQQQQQQQQQQNQLQLNNLQEMLQHQSSSFIPQNHPNNNNNNNNNYNNHNNPPMNRFDDNYYGGGGGNDNNNNSNQYQSSPIFAYSFRDSNGNHDNTFTNKEIGNVHNNNKYHQFNYHFYNFDQAPPTKRICIRNHYNHAPIQQLQKNGSQDSFKWNIDYLNSINNNKFGIDKSVKMCDMMNDNNVNKDVDDEDDMDTIENEAKYDDHDQNEDIDDDEDVKVITTEDIKKHENKNNEDDDDDDQDIDLKKDSKDDMVDININYLSKDALKYEINTDLTLWTQQTWNDIVNKIKDYYKMNDTFYVMVEINIGKSKTYRRYRKQREQAVHGIECIQDLINNHKLDICNINLHIIKNESKLTLDVYRIPNRGKIPNGTNKGKIDSYSCGICHKFTRKTREAINIHIKKHHLAMDDPPKDAFISSWEDIKWTRLDNKKVKCLQCGITYDTHKKWHNNCYKKHKTNNIKENEIDEMDV